MIPVYGGSAKGDGRSYNCDTISVMGVSGDEHRPGYLISGDEDEDCHHN
jgi:hypothetical protein